MSLTEFILPDKLPKGEDKRPLHLLGISRALLEPLEAHVRQSEQEVQEMWSYVHRLSSQNTPASTEDHSVSVQHEPSPGYSYGKDLYLLTPVRTKYFPKLSPTLLKQLLQTPPLRVSTPDVSCASDDGSASLPLTGIQLLTGGVSSNGDQGGTSGESAQADFLETYSRAACADPDGSFDDSGYLPTPPPSSKIPDVKAFCPTHDSGVQPSTTASAMNDYPSPVEERRSGRDVRSPLSPLSITSHSGLRTARSNLHALTHSKSITSLCTALQQHAHTGLSVGALQNFHRVMDELRGSREGRDFNESAELHAFQRASLPFPVRDPAVPASGTPASLHSSGGTELDIEAPNAIPSPLLSEQADDVKPVESVVNETSNQMLAHATEEEQLASALIALAESLKTTAERRRQIVLAHISY